MSFQIPLIPEFEISSSTKNYQNFNLKEAGSARLPACRHENKKLINQFNIKKEVLLQTFPSPEFEKTEQEHDNNHQKQEASHSSTSNHSHLCTSYIRKM